MLRYSLNLETQVFHCDGSYLFIFFNTTLFVTINYRKMSSRREVCRNSSRLIIKQIYKGEVDKLKEQLQNGAEVNGQDYDGDTLLHHAIASRNIKIVRLLVEHGADVNAENNSGIRPYKIALNCNFMEALELLLRNNAIINRVNDAIHLLPKHMVELFYDQIDIEARNSQGRTVLHVAVSVNLVPAVRRLLARGVDVKVRSAYIAETALHLVVSHEMAELLLDHGALLDACNRYAVTPLCEIAVRRDTRLKKNERTKIIELLIGRGANVLDVLVDADQHLDYNGDFDDMHGLKDVIKYMGLVEHESSYSEKISRAEFNRFYRLVLAEVTKMKETIFYCNVNFYEFLVKSWRQRVSYIDDKRIAKVVSSSIVIQDLEYKFPLYSDILERHVNAACERNELRENAAKFIVVVCPRLEGLYEVTERILTFLSRNDMISLCTKENVVDVFENIE